MRGADGIEEIRCFEWPQWIVEEVFSRELEDFYKNGNLKITGKKYPADSVNYRSYEKDFEKREFPEYQYGASKYIRFVGDENSENEYLSDGRKIKIGEVYWIKVELIPWQIDEECNIALAKNILFAGVQFQNSGNYTGDFDKTDISHFMNNEFARALENNGNYSLTNDNSKQTVSKRNPYGFCFDDMSEEDIIKGAIQSNVPVFLHGKSSDGKSARVKQLDPDCEIIYMRNATPDSFNGKSVYYEGKAIDLEPTWYLKVKEKCEKEPNKLHIVFFDELTNALHSIQGMAFNVILDKEINGKWKLPDNARIVAAGNELSDSLASHELAEPLFNRFAHVYIDTTVDKWLKWATTPKEKYERLEFEIKKENAKIHPSVYAFVAYRSYSGLDVLRTPYTGVKPNADPRKWEMASKILFKTKSPEMLRSLVGEELTRDFIAFTSQSLISVEDVIKENYTAKDLEMDISQKFATAAGLSSVDENNFEIVRNFMKLVGPEPRSAFESMWTHGDERRLEQLFEIQIKESLSEKGRNR